MAKPIKMTEMMFDSFFERLRNELAKKNFDDGEIRFSQRYEYPGEHAAVVHYTTNAWMKIQTLVQTFSSEIGWYGVAKKLGSGEYAIEDILVYPQKVTGVTVSQDDKPAAEWLNSLDDEVFNNLRFHGHSHVDMTASPSGVDDKLYASILEQMEGEMFYIFTIFNKKGDIFYKVYDLEENILYDSDEVETMIDGFDGGFEDFIKQAKTMVKTNTYSYKSKPGKAATTSATTGVKTKSVTAGTKTSGKTDYYGKYQNRLFEDEMDDEYSMRDWYRDLEDDYGMVAESDEYGDYAFFPGYYYK